MKKAFTVIEILIVIGIIAILTVIILPSLNNIRAKNRDTERISDIATIRLGLSLYYNQNDTGYPDNLNALSSYIPADALISPDGQTYEYVPLKSSSSIDNKCTYYHLGSKLELKSAQIDPDNLVISGTYSPVPNNTLKLLDFYEYCGDYNGPGINGTDELMYHTRP